MLNNIDVGSLNKYLVAMKTPSPQHYENLQHLIMNNLQVFCRVFKHDILRGQMESNTESCSRNSSHTCFS